MSEREYSAHSGLARRAIQKAHLAGRMVVCNKGWINVAAFNVRRTDVIAPDYYRNWPCRVFSPAEILLA